MTRAAARHHVAHDRCCTLGTDRHGIVVCEKHNAIGDTVAGDVIECPVTRQPLGVWTRNPNCAKEALR